MIRLIRRIILYYKIKDLQFDSIRIGVNNTSLVKYYHVIDNKPGSQINLHHCNYGDCYLNKDDSFVWVDNGNKIDRYQASGFSGIWGKLGDHEVLLYSRDGEKINKPRWKSLKKVKHINLLPATNMISEMGMVSSKNKTLLERIQDEIALLRADKENYIIAGLEEQYQKSFDVLMMNKSLVLSRQEIVDTAIKKAKIIQGEVLKSQKFLVELEAREKRIRDLSSENLKLHSDTASTLMLINDKIHDISLLSNICSGIEPITDEHRLLQLRESITLTENDFSKVFEEFKSIV